MILLNEEKKDIIKIVKYLQELVLLIKIVSEKTENEAKDRKGIFIGMLISASAASSLGNMFSSETVIQASKGTIRVGLDF